MSSFINKMLAKDGGHIRLITATERGKPCWFYLRLTSDKYNEYHQKLKHGKMNIMEYGKILRSGWGGYHPAEVINSMHEQFNYLAPEQESH